LELVLLQLSWSSSAALINRSGHSGLKAGKDRVAYSAKLRIAMSSEVRYESMRSRMASSFSYFLKTVSAI
ncbi:hypothetical protein, partial [Planococcus sp. ISL-110]|uniref:hypothetical protein n=1 Tax=Planococcus sp. ISL-110 TaxID=2819167 RepID=UPI001BE7040F